MSVRQTIGRLSAQRGRDNEARLLESVRRVGPGFTWYQSARAADKAEDRRGADVVVETSIGKLYLQAKSSRAGARKFAEQHRRIIVRVVILSGMQAWDDGRTRAALRDLHAAVESMRRA